MTGGESAGGSAAGAGIGNPHTLVGLVPAAGACANAGLTLSQRTPATIARKRKGTVSIAKGLILQNLQRYDAGTDMAAGSYGEMDGQERRLPPANSPAGR